MNVLSSVTGWDCHAHLFGPYDRFPLAPGRSYTPPEALEARYLALLDSLGLSHGVLVHPSAYGDDFSLLFDALAAQSRLRGVIVTRAATPAQLKEFRSRGVRAARFSHRSEAGANFAGSASFDHLLNLASVLANAGLHAELWTDCAALPAIASQLRHLPVPVVIDHMGGFNYQAGVDDASFRLLLSLLESGDVWVKLCAYRNVLTAPSLESALPFHLKMLEANPEQLVWGTDWPHLRVTPPPDTAGLLQMFKDWTASEILVHRILVENPTRLYG